MVRKTKNDILQGTLALLVLKTLASQGRMHGYAITAHIQRVSNELLRVEEGSLYPALHRMEDDGWVRAEWEDVDPVVEGRPARRYYLLTPDGLANARTELAALHAKLRPRGIDVIGPAGLAPGAS